MSSSDSDAIAIATPEQQMDISQLPSVKDGSMTVQEESLKRRQTCRFIEEVARVLQLKRVVTSTAMVFFHRFYAKHSFATHDRLEVSAAAILLAAKDEEDPRKLNEVIEESYNVKLRGMSTGRVSPTSVSDVQTPTTMTNMNGKFDPNAEQFIQLKERILKWEMLIMYTIGFELLVEHPYKFVVDMCKELTEEKRQLEYIQPSDNDPAAGSTADADADADFYTTMSETLIEYSMNFANDSFQTTLCLQFVPEGIAMACVYLAAHFAKVRPTENKSWLELLEIPDVESFTSIAVQIMEIVCDRNKGDDTSQCDKIKKDLEALNEDKKQPSSPPSSEPDAKRQRIN